MNTRLLTGAASAVAIAVICTACSAGGHHSTFVPAGLAGHASTVPADARPAMPTSPSSAAPVPSSTPAITSAALTLAADFRATLTGLLDDHVWLVGNAADALVQHRGVRTDAAVRSAVEALDANTRTLARAVGHVVPNAWQPFIASWRLHNGFYLDYAQGEATHNAKQAARAKADLKQYGTSFGQLVHSIAPGVPTWAVARDLAPHVQAILAAIDADAAGKPDFEGLLTAAADHMAPIADLLAGGIASAQHLTGDVDAPASDLRSRLTLELADQVWLAGNSLEAAVRHGGVVTDTPVAGAITALGDDMDTLSATFTKYYPKDAAQLMDPWRQEVGDYIRYALAKAHHSGSAVSDVKSDLATDATSYAQAVHTVIPTVSASSITSNLMRRTDATLAAIDAGIANSPNYQTLLAAAADQSRGTADRFAVAIAADRGI